MQPRTSPNSLALAFVALASPAMVATAAQAEERPAGEVMEVPIDSNALVIQTPWSPPSARLVRRWVRRSSLRRTSSVIRRPMTCPSSSAASLGST